MIQRKYCEQCGKLVGVYMGELRYNMLSFSFYASNTAEPLCTCPRNTALTVNSSSAAWSELGVSAKPYSYPETVVPDVFQQAFADGDLEP